MRTPLSLMLLLLLSAGLFADVRAQNRPADRSGLTTAHSTTGTVTGLVLDGETGDPLPTATITVLDPSDASLVTGAITTANGTFLLENLPFGTYDVRVSFVGFRTETIEDVRLGPGSLTAEVGTLRLATESAELGEVTVSAQREYIEVHADKTVYNTREQAMTAGGSAQDVLETIPSIEVDFEGNLSLRGNENVVVYLDGKPAPMSGDALTSFLQGLSAESIERVEVIPNPSARYEPEGMAGILNIVLARDRERGWGGGVSASASTNDRYNGSVNGHYTSGPWSFYTTYSLRDDQRTQDLYRLRENRLENPVTFLEQNSFTTGGGTSHNVNTSIDYRLSDLNTVSLSARLSDRGRTGERENQNVGLFDDQTVFDRYVDLSSDDRSDLGMDYRLGFRRAVRPNENEWNVDLRYECDAEEEFERLTMQTVDDRFVPVTLDPEEDQRIRREETGTELTAQVDYVRALGEALRAEAGYQGSVERIDSDLFSQTYVASTGTFEPDVDRNNAFAYEEQGQAGYGIVSGGRGRFEAQVGLRGELVRTKFDLLTTDESYDHRYASLFPSAHISYSPNDGHTLRASYSKRVRRPSTWQLNPFGDFSDPTFRRMGNPELDPEYTHSFELGVTQLGNAYTLSLTPYFRHTVDEISWHEEITADGVSILTFRNYDTSDSWGLELIGSLNVSDWLRGNASFNAYRQVTNASNLESGLSSDAFAWTTRLQTTFTLTEGLDLQISRFFRAASDVPGGRRGSFGTTNLAINQKLMGGRANLSLRASDLLGSSGFEMQRDTPQFAQTFRRSWDAQNVQVSFRYNFGTQQRNRRPDRGMEGGDAGGDAGYGEM